MTMVINVVLIILFCYIALISYYSDKKNGIIPNKNLLVIGIIAVILKILDYKNIDIMIIQLVIACICSLLFYLLHIWAGGDSKLFIVEAILTPNILYVQDRMAIFQVIVFSYSSVYVYLIIDSIYAYIRKKETYNKLSLKNINVKFFIMNWLLVFLASADIQKLLYYLLRKFYIENYIIFVFGNMFFVLIMKEVLVKLSRQLRNSLLILLLVLFMVLSLISPINFKIDLKNVIIVLVIVILREWADRYSYTPIKTLDIKKGMILSASSVMLFLNSNIKGLPMKVSEDMAARLTDEEVDSIKRWARTKNGKDELIIVKKIPFAFFINIGYAIFMIIGGYKLWLGT